MSAPTSEKVLFVDDDPSLVEGIVRHLRKRFDVTPAAGGPEGLGLIETEGPFAVVVSDFRMPGMDGVRFLAKVREASPDSVRVMLTGHADLDMAVQAVNDGHIFRFLTKPCPPEALAKALDAALEQYRLVTAERILLQRTLHGSIKVLTDLLALASPAAFGRAMRVRKRARSVAARLGMPDAWRVELAAMLSPLGCVTMPPDALEKVYLGKPLGPGEQQMFEKHPQLGHDLIAKIPRLEKVAEIVAYQEKKYNGLGVPRDDVAGERIPLGARILKLVLDFDTLESSGCQKAQALEKLNERTGWYDPRVLAAFTELLSAETEGEVWSVALHELKVGMVTVDDVRIDTGLIVLARGQEITEPLLERLGHFARRAGIEEPIRVYAPRQVALPHDAPSPAGRTL